jgi:hypothetical protein
MKKEANLSAKAGGQGYINEIVTTSVDAQENKHDPLLSRVTGRKGGRAKRGREEKSEKEGSSLCSRHEQASIRHAASARHGRAV